MSLGSAQVFDNFKSNQAVIDHHGIIVATTDAAVHILKDTSSQFVVFFDEFMTASGNKNSPTFAQNMEPPPATSADSYASDPLLSYSDWTRESEDV